MTNNAYTEYPVFKFVPILREGGSDNGSYYSQIELVDINRNNKRLWGNLDCEVGSKIWKSMEALGVVYKGGEKGIVERINNLEKEAVLRKGNRKEKKRVHHVYKLFKLLEEGVMFLKEEELVL